MTPFAEALSNDRAFRVAVVETSNHLDGDKLFDIKDFGRFIELCEVVQNGADSDETSIALSPDPVEMAVATALAVLVRDTMWPPPGWVTDAICQLLRSRLCEPEEQVRRAAEVTVAYLAGWEREMEPNAIGWDAAQPDARWVLWTEMHKSVQASLVGLQNRVIDFPDNLDVDEWTNRILYRFLDVESHCQCWARATSGRSQVRQWTEEELASLDLDDIASLVSERSNAFRKATTCFSWHHIRHFELQPKPEEGEAWDLWRFAQKAVKGFLGAFDKRAGSFPAGMLFDALQKVYPLRLANVAEHYCRTCQEWSVVADHCPKCQTMVSEPWLVLRGKRGRLILALESDGNREQEGGGHPVGSDAAGQQEWQPPYAPGPVWACGNPTCEGLKYVSQGSLYPAHHCGDQCGTRHDHCPACGTPHASGRTKTLFFYRRKELETPGDSGLPTVPETADTGLEYFQRHLLQEPVQQASDRLRGWQKMVAFWLRDQLDRRNQVALDLVRAPHRFRGWQELWSTLRDDYDVASLPKNYEELRQQFLDLGHPIMRSAFTERWKEAGMTFELPDE